MRNLFTQLFQQVYSNQTNERQSRDYRNGGNTRLRPGNNQVNTPFFSTRTMRAMRYVAAIAMMVVLSIGEVWGASVAEGTYTFVNQTIGAATKFYKIDNGIYQYRLNAYGKNASYGIQLPATGDGTGFAFHLASTQKVYVGICKKNSKKEVVNNLYIKTITKANFDALEAGSNNSTTVSLTLGGSATLSQNHTFASQASQTTEGATVYLGELSAGYYYVYGNSTGGEGNLYSISFGTQTLFLVPNDKANDNAKFAIYYFPGNSGYECIGWSDYMTVSPCNASTYRADIPKGYTKLIFVRLNPSGGINWDSKWNQTGNLTFDGSKDKFTWANGSWDGATTTWSASTKYTISFAANGGSGSMSNVSSIACGRSVTLAANAYTKSGYTFAGWKTNVAVTANGSAVAANGIVADGATISNITSDITLTAQWESDAPAVCTAPTALTAGSTTAKGTTFTVTDGEDTNNYEFYVSESSSAPDAETSATYTSTSKTKTITDLYAGTTRYAWVRSVCGVSNKSDWVALTGSTFTTSTVSVTHTLTNVTKTSGATSGVGGSTYTAVYSANTGYSMPTPNVTIDGNTATSGTDYTWTSGTGTISIPANKINGNIVITLNSVPSAPSSAVISGTYHYFPGENISLTCTPSGNNGPTTYQWYKGGKADGNRIDGATSATFTKNSCAFEDAGSYYCKVTCNATSIWAVTNSHENYDVRILRLYVNGSKGGDPYGNVDFVKVDGTTATASISLGSNWTYGFNIADGCGHYYGNNGTMQYNSCTGWTTNVNGTDCGLTTTNAATYTFTINYSNLDAIVTSVTYPIGNQASGKVIYFDNNVLKWTGSSIYYRIGHSSHSQADQLSLVPGTANLYKMTTREYNGFSAWQIGNAEGGNGSDKSIYNTKNTPAITASIAYEGGAVTADAVTVTPGVDHSTGGDAQNNNCEFYSKTITNGMKTDNVAISPYSNGTITVNYVNTSNVASNFTSGYQDLAHTVILTSITAVPNTGYDASAITINGGAYSANYVVTGATTIAASFTPHVYSITYKDQGGSAFSGSHVDSPSAHPTSHTYNTATTLNSATKAGYAFGGWYTNSSCTGDPVASLGATAFTADITLYAKWTCVTPTFETNLSTTEVNYNVGDAASALTVAATAGGGTVTYQWYKNTANSTTTPTPTALTTGASYTPSTAAAGTTYYFCIATNSTAGCSSTVTSNIAPVTVAVGALITWRMKVDQKAWELKSSTTTEGTNITSIASTADEPGSTSTGATGTTGKVLMASGESNVDKAASFTFIVNSAKKVVPTQVTCKVLNVSSGNRTYKAQISDNNGHVYYSTNTVPITAENTLTDATFNFADGLVLVGNVTLKVYAWKTSGSPTQFRMGEYIKLYGTVENTTDFTVTHTLTNVTKSAGATSVKEGNNYTATYAGGAGGYTLPSTISVTIGGETATAGTDYTWTQGTGVLTIPGNKVTGNIVISIVGGDPVDYDISYHLNGASWKEGYSAPTQYTGGVGVDLPSGANMTNTGYTFAGWKNNSSLTGDTYTSVSTSDYGNKEFWAKWTENTYDVTYNANGGSGTTDAQNGHYVTLRDNGFTAPSGKTFVEWNTATDGSGASYNEGEEVELTDDLDLYAIWADDYTITWGNVQLGGAGATVTPNLGGGNYTITASVASWTGTLTTGMISTETEGVTITNVAVDNSSSPKTITATFSVGASVEGTSITLELDVPEADVYGAKESTKEIAINRCASNIVWDFTTNAFLNGGSWSTSSGVENKAYATDGTTILKYYAGGSSDEWDSGNKQLKTQGTTAFSTGSNKKQPTQKYFKFPVLSETGTISVTYGTNNAELKIYEATSNNIYGLDPIITLSSSSTTSSSYAFSSGKTYYMTMESAKAYFKNITFAPAGATGPVATSLTWSGGLADGGQVTKDEGVADFTYTASTTSNTLGAITYTSSDAHVTVSSTGKVHIGSGIDFGGAEYKDITITANLAESGCYESASITYTLRVNNSCEDVAGTIGTENLGCEGIRMTITGHTAAAGVTYQWYKDGVSLGSAAGAQTTTYTATAAGEYYVIVTNTGTGHCPMASANTVVVAAQSAATATKIVDEWYVKNGRRTPDIALVQTTNATGFIVKSGSTTIWNSDSTTTTGFGGCGFHMEENGIIYLNGTKDNGDATSGLTAGDEVLTFIAKACGGDASKDITIHKQVTTDRASVAYVSLGTEKGAVTDTTAGYYKTAPLYIYLDHTLSGGAFDLTARNIYWSVDEQKLREHYSQFDAIVITDDPNTGKKKDGKSYVDAMGALIDIRPMLTMEAWVSGLANWKAKGIDGNPTSPNPRQYAMTLECKDHEIFAGLDPASANVDVTAEGGIDYWKVKMVDKEKSPYSGVADDSETGDKPALQGFSASDVSGLLLLGEISNGSLYAGVERQEEPAARLMLLGLNAKALPNALTTEGKTVIKNAITYLLKTNMEDVDDCSNYFTGATSTDWNTASNWFKNTVPNSPTTKVRILAPCEVGTGGPFHAASIDIATSGTSGKKAGTCNGSLTIAANGALIVGGKIRSAEAPYFNTGDLKPTAAADLVLNTSSTNQAALVFNNDKGDTKATVNLYSLGRKESGAYQFQYMAVPMNYIDVNPAFAGSGIYTYVWKEPSNGWERRAYYAGLSAFEGVGITTKSGSASNYTLQGALTSTTEKAIQLTTEGSGQNIIGNSWTAPIDIASLRTALVDDDNIVDKTIYIYCAGNDGASVHSGATETAGQWLAIPIEAAAWGAWGGLKVIPAMQAFCIKANTGTTLTLNYKDHVRSTASAQLNQPLRAPKREAEQSSITLTNIRVADSKTHTDLYLFEGEKFSEEFDNGWEAKYMSGDGRSAKLYAETEIGKMAVVALPELEGTILGFAPGKETEYTFSFSGAENGYYLNDLKLKQSTLIEAENSYNFTFEEGDTNRFYISRTPIDKPEITTDVENAEGEALKPHKILYNDKLYILFNGRVFDATGKVVK